MEGVPATIAEVVRSLRPIGLWFGSSTALLALVIWCYHGEDFSTWPMPLRCFTWGWLGAWSLAVPYVHVGALFAQRAATITGRSEPAVTAQPPVLVVTAGEPAAP